MDENETSDLEREWWQRAKTGQGRAPATDKKPPWIIWGIVGVLVVVGLAGAQEELVTKIIVVSAIGAVIYALLFRNRTPRAIKDKPDHLGSKTKVVSADMWWRLAAERPDRTDQDEKPSTFYWWAAGAAGVLALAASAGEEAAIGTLQLLFWAGITWVGYRWLSQDRTPVAIKDRPDHLGEQAAAAVVDKLSDPGGVWAGQIGSSNLFAAIEDRAVVLGPPGAGKTAFMITQILQWAISKRPFICLDTKPEIFGAVREALAARGYRTLVYNPTAGRGQRYNPLVDIEGPEAIGEFAAALVTSNDPAAAIFDESARDLLDALISHLVAIEGQASLPAIRDLINTAGNHQTLLRILGASPDPDVVDIARNLAMAGANQRLLGSIFATLRTNLRFLRYPNIRASLETADFSLAEFEGEKPVALFLQFEEHQRETTARLLAAMVTHIMRYLINHTARPPVLLLLDEIGTVPPIPGLIDKLNTIRSRNLPTWTYWQSLEQMQRYGAKADEGPNLILGACDYQMVFRLNDNTSAKWMSERIGVVDVVTRSESVGPGWFEGASESASLVTEPKVFPHELQQLKDGQVVCTYRDHAWRGEAPPYYEIWPRYRGKKPVGDELLGEPYPVNGTDGG